MGVGRPGQAQGRLDPDLGGGDGAQVGAPHHLGDPLGAVVHHHRQVVGVAPVPAMQQRVAGTLLRIVLLGAQHPVVPGHGTGRQVEAQGVRAQERQRPVPAGARVGPQTVLPVGGRGHGGQIPAGAHARVQAAGLEQSLQGRLVRPLAPGLPQHRPVALQAQGRQVPQLGVAQAAPAAGVVHVLHAHQPAPALGPRRQPGGQGGAQVAQVQFAGGGGREAAGAGHALRISAAPATTPPGRGLTTCNPPRRRPAWRSSL